MRKFFMFYNYLGAGYGGLQRLHNRTKVDLESIQGIIEFGLRKVLGTNFFPPIGISGRTDRGVNALNALCHFVIHEKDFKEDIYNFSPESICRQLNIFFEGNGTSIRAHRIVEVLPENHSRGNVVSRVYQYRIAVLKDNYYPNCTSYKKLSSQLPVSELFRCYAITNPFDLEAAYKACRLFLGTYNYKSFMKSSLDTQEYTEENYTKTIYRISFNSNNYSEQLKYFDSNYEKFDFYDFHVTGSGFLRQQVRLIVGVLIGIGQGKATEEDIIAMLNEPSHEHFAGAYKVKNSNRFKSQVLTASPYGLYLKEVNLKGVTVLRGYLS